MWIIWTAVRLMFVEKMPCLMLVTDGTVWVVALKAWFKAPITMNPFMLEIRAVSTTEVNPETGAEMDMVGVV